MLVNLKNIIFAIVNADHDYSNMIIQIDVRLSCIS